MVGRQQYQIATQVALAIAIISLAVFPGSHSDWDNYFRPAALNWRNPYALKGIYNPPWLYILLWPLAILPSPLGYMLVTFLSFLAVGLITRNPWATIAVALSCPGFAIIYQGQIDGLILWALLLPLPVKLAGTILKPQGILLAAGVQSTWKDVAALAGITAISFIIWPGWILAIDAPWGYLLQLSPLPLCIPLFLVIGLAVAAMGLGRKNMALLCLANLILAPFWSPASMIGVATYSLQGGNFNLKKAIAVIVTTWAYFFIRMGIGAWLV